MGKVTPKTRGKENHLLIFLLSCIVGYVLLTSNVVEQFLVFAKDFELLGVLIAGALCTSLFTVVPATIVIAEISEYGNLFHIVVVGGFGAALADCFMLYFFENQIRLHLANSKDRGRYRRLQTFFKTPGMHMLGLIVGSLLIALPVPDELGLAFMGMTNVKVSRLFPIAFVANMLGIFLIGEAARTFLM